MSKEQAMVYEITTQKTKEPHYKAWENSSAPDGFVVSTPLVASVVLLLNDTNII
jgi:hypothetical protein